MPDTRHLIWRAVNGEWRVVKMLPSGGVVPHLTPDTRHLTPLLRALALAALTVPYSLFPVPSQAQGPTYRWGSTPTKEEIRAWDISVGPEGKELPLGSGTAKEGAKIFAQRCAACHGPTGVAPAGGGRPLVGGKGTLKDVAPLRTIGSFWPFATTVWDYINRAMPKDQEGTLSADEVYALTAFLLYRNDIIKESDVLDAKTLPKIQMPNRHGFVPAEPKWNPQEKKQFGLYP